MKVILAFFILLISISAFAQHSQEVKNDSLITWSQNYQLKWSDFKGKIPSEEIKGTSAAVTCSGWQSSLQYSDGVIEGEYVNVFHRLQSWTIDTTSSQLLNHEQLHFDISEVFCRKVRKGIFELIEKDAITVESLQTLIDSLSNEKDYYQSLFDKETAHGTYGLKQLEWRKKTDDELENLSPFADSFIKEQD